MTAPCPVCGDDRPVLTGGVLDVHLNQTATVSVEGVDVFPLCSGSRGRP